MAKEAIDEKTWLNFLRRHQQLSKHLDKHLTILLNEHENGLNNSGYAAGVRAVREIAQTIDDMYKNVEVAMPRLIKLTKEQGLALETTQLADIQKAINSRMKDYYDNQVERVR